jgi:hypothetical protein
MSDLPPPPPGGGFTPPPPPPPPGGGFTPPPPPPDGGYTPSPPPAGYIPPPAGGYAPAGVGYAGPRTDGLAIGALITGILAVICFWICLGLILGPAAAIMGFISRQRVAASGGTVGGGGLALAGMILGIVGFVFSGAEVIWWIFVASHNVSTTPSP